MSLNKQVWKELSHVDLTKMVEKKMKLTYLSWANCWQVVKEYYPESTFTFQPPEYYTGGTVEVSCVVTIRDGEESYDTEMTLPVMDNRNNSIVEPTSREISDARMRCLVKCVAVATGLGLYIYRGEDLPDPDKDHQTDLLADIAALIARGKDKELVAALKDIDANDKKFVWSRLDTGQREYVGEVMNGHQ